MNSASHNLPPLGQVIESALYVDDLAGSAAFYEDVLRLRRLVADDRFRAYAAGERNVLLLFQRGATSETVHLPGGTIPPHGYVDGASRAPSDQTGASDRSEFAQNRQSRVHQHIAFSVTLDGLARWGTALEATGVVIEGRTDWPKGGHSIYFRDPDGHLLELATPGLWPIPGG